MRRIIQSRNTDPRNAGNWDRDIEVLGAGAFIGLKIIERRENKGSVHTGFSNLSLKAAEELLTTLDLILSNPEDDFEDDDED